MMDLFQKSYLATKFHGCVVFHHTLEHNPEAYHKNRKIVPNKRKEEVSAFQGTSTYADI